MDLVGWLFVLAALSLNGVAAFDVDEATKDAPQFSQNQCTFCEISATLWTDPSVKHQTDGELTATALSKVCGDLPKPLDKDCSKFVTERGLGMIRLLKGGWTAEKLCSRFGHCSGGFQKYDAPNTGTQLGNHIDESDMPEREQLDKPELVPPNLRTVALKEGEVKGEKGDSATDVSLLELFETLGGDVGSEMNRAKQGCAYLWHITYTIALKWMQPDNTSNSKSKSNANAKSSAAMALLQTEQSPEKFEEDSNLLFRGLESVTTPTHILGEQATKGQSCDKEGLAALQPHHIDLLRSVEAHLATKVAAHNPQSEKLQQLVQVAQGAAPANTTELVERIHSLAGEVMNVQLGARVGAGKSAMWSSVVQVYWSFLFASWIRGQIDGTGT